MRGVGTVDLGSHRQGATGTVASGAPPETKGVRAVYDADGYRSSVRGVSVETFRTGVGVGPNLVRATQATSLAATSIKVNFPILSRATIPKDRIIVAAVLSSPPGNSWCGMDLEPGLVVVYGPGVEHTAVNPVGTRFAFAAIDLLAVKHMAEGVKLDLGLPGRGEIVVLRPSAESRVLTDRLRRLLQADETGDGGRRVLESNLLFAIGRILRSDRRRGTLNGNRIDSRRVTNDCLEYAEAVGRVPSVEEMCAASHVSERRLRTAFAEAYGMPPTQFFRVWALAKANEHLQTVDPRPGIVSRVAMDLGFTHLGRFATRYRRIYGEPPSHTAANGRNDDPIRAETG